MVMDILSFTKAFIKLSHLENGQAIKEGYATKEDQKRKKRKDYCQPLFSFKLIVNTYINIRY